MTLTPQQKAELDAKIQAAKAARMQQPAQGLTPEQKAELDARIQQAKSARPEEEPGTLQKVGRTVTNFGREIIRPVVKFGVTGVAAADAAIKMAQGDLEGANRVTREGYNVPGFGQVAPNKIASDVEIKRDASGNESMEGGKFGRETLKTIGTGAEIASIIVGGGEANAAVRGAGNFAAKGLGKRIVQGAVEGAATGATGGFGAGVQEDDATVGSVIASTLGGAALGGVAGGAIPAASGAAKRFASNVRDGTESAAEAISKGFDRAKEFVPGSPKIADDEAASLIVNGTPDARVATKAIGEGGKVVTDKVAHEVVRQGIPEADVALIRSGSASDKAKMLEMLKIRESQLTNKRITERATDIVGDTFVEKVAKPIEQLNKDAGRKLQAVAKKLAGQKVDASEAIVRFSTDLESSGVGVRKDGTLNFKGSDFEEIPVGPLIQNVWKRALRVAKTGDALQVHRMKSYLDEIVNYGKQAEGLSGKAQNMLKNFRHSVDSLLDASFPEYNRVNTQYAETIQELDRLGAAIGKTFRLGDSFADAQAGVAMRRILSNTQSRSEILRMLDNMQALLKKYKIKVDDDVITQANFADVLERMLGSEAPTSFLGQGERFLNQAEQVAGAGTDLLKGNVVSGTLKAGKYVIDMTRGISQENKLKALRALLEREAGAAKPRTVFGKR